MNIKKRQAEILRDIILEKDKVDYPYLIEKHSVSERTLRNDLNAIDDYLLALDIPILKRSKKDGISFDGTMMQQDKILWEVNAENKEHYILDQDERVDFLFFSIATKRRASFRSRNS